MKKPILLLALLGVTYTLFAQKIIDAKTIARQHLTQNAKAWQLTPSDMADVGVQYSYTTEDNGLTHVYLVQQRDGIEVYNAIVNVNVTKTGDVIYAGNRFVSDLTVNTNKPQLTAADAIAAAARCFGITNIPKLTPSVLSDKKGVFVFSPSGISQTEMHAQLRYQPLENAKIARLAWDLDINPLNGNDHWSVRVDALTGEILDKNSWTVHCNFDHPHSDACQNIDASLKNAFSVKNTEGVPLNTQNAFSVKNTEGVLSTPQTDFLVKNTEGVLSTPQTAFSVKNTEGVLLKAQTAFSVKNTEGVVSTPKKDVSSKNIANLTVAGGTYNVFKLPAESPTHGSQILVTNPADPIASPFGWHDTNGVDGAEYTTTRGNNVHAVIDSFNRRLSFANGIANTAIGGEAEGGAALNFDFPYNAQAEPREVRNLAVTNLFYMNNMLHDISFRYGMNDDAGAFQEKNYSGVAGGNDFVIAQAQDGGYLPIPNLNNANFATPPDGRNGMMQMYLWQRGLSPSTFNLIHNSTNTTHYTGNQGTFGPKLTTTPIVGLMSTTLNCNPSANVRGRIVLLDTTPSCSFAKMVINVQDSGAIACIICNVGIINDTFPADRSRVTIPVITTNSTNCAALRQLMANNSSISLYRNAADTLGADLVDGDFDNGIVAHEYGHGISNRLTGGPQNVSCLSSGEQMGEGWSDFMGLVISTKVGDNGAMKRGIGNFALHLPVDGIGIRRFPYSTNMAINPHTYDNLFLPDGQASPHPIGEIWCSTIWDMYWKFTDKYGFDANIMNTRSGNGKAIKLVFDGMKIQPCVPGMLDGRDAIIAADKVNNNSENVCMIWEAFARRGMGYSAFQGKGSIASDNIEAFDMPPACIKTVRIAKTMTPSVLPGQPIEVRLKIYNFRDTSASVTVIDTLPSGATFITGSSTRTPTTVTATTLTFPSFTVAALDSATIVYRIQSDPAKKSIAQFYDNMENPNNTNWTTSGSVPSWIVSPAYSNSGNSSFFADGVTPSTEKILRLNVQAVIGQQPMLRFFHKYETEGGFDAGVVEVSRNGVIWENAAPLTFRNPALARTNGTFGFADKTYWGNSNGFVASYIDLSSYKGLNVHLRYRLRTNLTNSSVGWALDDVLMMDAASYNAGVRMTAVSGLSYRDTARTIATQRGTIVEPEIRVSTKETAEFKVAIYPNPTQNVVNVVLSTPSVSEAKATVLAIDGKVLWVQNLLTNSQIDLSDFASGLYFLKVETDKGIVQQKIVKQ
jgi:extracellular elastinolytic metalloproteinase